MFDGALTASGCPRQMVADRSGQGPAVVLLHGQPGSATEWRRLVPYLEPDFSVVVPDRPGYGRTGGAATGFAGNARLLVDLLDREGLDRAVVVGHSWGGGIAIAAAESYPGRVAGLVLVSSVAPGGPVGWIDRLLAAPGFGDVFAALTIGVSGRVLGTDRVQQMAARRLRGRALEAVSALSSLTGGRSGARVWRSFVVEQRALLQELEHLGRGLPGIRAPTEIVNGTADHIVPPSVGDLLARAIPGADHTVIDHAGHLLPRDHPVAIADGVRRVWRRAG